MQKRIFKAILALCILIANLLSSFPAPQTASAALSVSQPAALTRPMSGDYACILEDAFFYSVPDENHGVFLLPQTYYVRLLEYGTDYCKIEYGSDGSHTQKLVGYAKTKALTFVNYVPVRPYLTYLFDVTYSLDGADDSAFLNQITMTCAYYGDYKVGSKTYCYVLREGEFGYVPKPASLAFEENYEYADYLDSLQTNASASVGNPPSAPSAASATPLQIATLVALCLLVPLLAALVLRPPRKPPYETED